MSLLPGIALYCCAVLPGTARYCQALTGLVVISNVLLPGKPMYNQAQCSTA